MFTKHITVLFAPTDGWGHINNSHRFAEALRDRGHRVVFAVDIEFKGKLKPFGFEEEVLSKPNNNGVKDGHNFMANIVLKSKDVFKLSAIEIVEKFCFQGFEKMFEDLRERDSHYMEIIGRVKPDLIVIASYIGSPTLTNSGVPFVWLYCAAPLMAINSDKLPPPWSGLPLNGDQKDWIEFNHRFNKCYEIFFNKVNDWFVSTGAKPLRQDNTSSLHPLSEHLNLYVYPNELDYKEVQPLSHNWRRVDCIVRKTDETFEIPAKLRAKPGKLLFLSMGSFGSVNVDLMLRLTTILGKSNHRYIVSKGPLHHSYELPANMWGKAFLPQTAVLPLVDAVLTHGGNNTVTESFYFGKPMLVLPLFGDQLDNAQRLQETGLGLRLNPFHCSEEELLSAVDQLVNDWVLCESMKTIGKRMRESNDKQIIAEMFENIVSKSKLK